MPDVLGEIVPDVGAEVRESAKASDFFLIAAALNVRSAR